MATMSHPYQQPYTPQPPVPPARPAPKPKKWGWVLGIIGAFLLGLMIGGAGGAGQTGTTTTTTAPAGDGTVTQAAPPPKPAGPATTMEDGTYQVGVDVQAGQYKTPGPNDDPLPCYWSRSKDDSGELTSIIANDVVQGPSSVTINAGEYIKVSGHCTWTKAG